MKLKALAVAAVVLACGVAGAGVRSMLLPFVESGAIKTWATGDKLTSADLNANFQHIHGLMVGGHGARLMDSDVNASANIATSKLAGKTLIPVAWATVLTNCTSTPCTIDEANGISSITRSGAGTYNVVFTTPRPDSTWGVVLTAGSCSSGNCTCTGKPGGIVTTDFSFVCSRVDTGTAASVDAAFTVVVYDAD